MKEKKAKQAAMAGPGGGSLDQGAVAMAKEGAPQTMIVKGIGKNSGLEWSAIRRAAIMQIADEEDMSIDEAGAEFARRQLDFGATKGSQNQLQKMLGASRAAVKQLDFNIGKTIETLKSMPGSDLSPITNAIARGEQKWTGDPKYSQLFFFMHASLMESARILSGGQASIAQLQTQAAEDAKKWANVNMTPESFINGAAPAMLAEGKNRLETYEQAYNEQRNRRDRPSSGGSAPDSGAAMSLDDYLKSQGH